MSTQFLPSIRDTETFTCLRCNRPQFPRDGDCIACHYPLPLRYLKFEIDSLQRSCTEKQRDQIAHSLGAVLRLLRKQRRMSQSQLANLAANMNRSYLSKLECGNVLLPVSKLLPLAQALGLTAVILRFEDPDSRKASKTSGSG